MKNKEILDKVLQALGLRQSGWTSTYMGENQGTIYWLLMSSNHQQQKWVSVTDDGRVSVWNDIYGTADPRGGEHQRPDQIFKIDMPGSSGTDSSKTENTPEKPDVAAVSDDAKGKQSSSTSDQDDQKSNLGIDGPHFPAGTGDAPEPYKGGAPVVNDPDKTFSFEDKEGRWNTISETASGAKVQQVAGVNPETNEPYTPYQIKAPDTPAIDTSKLAWHQNPNWTTPDQSAVAAAKLDPSQVLEQRPGADGRTIFRLADGTYVSYDPSSGQNQPAGTWAKEEWSMTQGGQVVPSPTQTAPSSTDSYNVTTPSPSTTPSSTPDVPPPSAAPSAPMAAPHRHLFDDQLGLAGDSFVSDPNQR